MLDVLSMGCCAGCGYPGTQLCRSCSRRLAPCGPLDAPPPLARLAAGWGYEGPARSLVLGLKLRGRRGLAAPLAEAMAAAAYRRGITGEVVTWIPGRAGDVRNRGFDHAEVLARGVGARLGLPVVPLLQPAGPKADQTGLDSAQRWENLKGAFVARNAHGGVVLVDDVMTTGATIRAGAGALSAAGASRIEGLVACRA